MPAHSARFLGWGLATVAALGPGPSAGQTSAPPVSSLPPESGSAPAVELVTADAATVFWIGAAWEGISGNEVDAVDPAPVFEVGASRRFWHDVSLWVSAAVSKHSILAQTRQLLDQPLTPTRSGLVDGDVSTRRLRAGIRLDGLGEPGWPFAPYVVAAASWSTVEVEIASVNGVAPPPAVPDVRGNPVDVSKFDDSQIGGLGRFGVEYALGARVRIDAHVDYEVLEFPPGTGATVGAGGGAVLRF